MYFNIRFISLCIIVQSLFLVISCTDYEVIFASIESEEKIFTSNLSDETTGLGMALMNDNYLIATGGAIFYRNKNGSTWNTLKLPAGYEGANRIVEITPNLLAYAVLIKDYYKNSTDYTLFKLTPEANIVKFEPVHTSSDFMDIAVQTGEGVVFAMVGETDNRKYYANYQNPDPEPLTFSRTYNGVSKTTTTNSGTMVGVAKYKEGFYLAIEGELFLYRKTTAILEKVFVKAEDLDLTGYIGGVYYSTIVDALLLSHGSASDGGSYLWKGINIDGDGDPTTDDFVWTWTKSAKKSQSFYTCFVDIDQTAFTGVLVGTRYYRPGIGRDEGYIELPIELPDGDINIQNTPIGNKYTSGKLDTSAVLGFYVDGTTFFVLTSNLGLWRGTYNATRSIDWFLE